MGKLLEFKNPNAQAPPDKDAERFMTALSMAYRLVSDIENSGIRSSIIFSKHGDTWSYSYCNMDGAQDIITALGPLWFSALQAIKDGDND